MTQKFSDVARAELAADITDVATSFTITAGGDLFPVADTGSNAIGPNADWFKVTLVDEEGYETVYVRTHASGSNTFTDVLRGQEGTTARAFSAIHPASGRRTIVGLRVSAADFDRFEATHNALGNKVDKVAGKGLSTEDYTTAEKSKLAGIEAGAQVNPTPVDDVTSTSATLPLSANQGRVLKGLIDSINTLLQSDDSTLDELQEIVNYIKLNREDLETLTIGSIIGLEDALSRITGFDEGAAAPTNPNAGHRWLDRVSGAEYTWVVENGTGAWVELGAPGVLEAAPMATMEEISLGEEIEPRTFSPALIAQALRAFVPVFNPVAPPKNASPLPGQTIRRNTNFQGTPFHSAYGRKQKASQLQLSYMEDFSEVFWDSGTVLGEVNGVNGVVMEGKVPEDTQLFWRLRYQDVDDIWSEWSHPTAATTPSTYLTVIDTPEPTPDTIGAAFAGGYYAGMMWQQLTTSESFIELVPGTHVFEVPEMEYDRIVYLGQSLEVRRKSNPNIKLIGTVVDARGTLLTLNVTEVSGTGVFNDWSVMARFRIVDMGVTANQSTPMALKTNTTGLPTACRTLNEGSIASAAMRSAANRDIYPAAWAATTYYSGAYLPSRNEMELLWRAFKPVTDNNFTTANRPVSQYDYQVNGSFGDTSNQHGVNNNSIPPGTPYTATDPAQTTVTRYQTGGASALVLEAGKGYWTSSDFSATEAWILSVDPATPGAQLVANKTEEHYVRYIKRIVI